MEDVIVDTIVNTIVNTPLCPVCRNNYSDKVKPNVLQPCGHGMCSECLDLLKDYSETKSVQCPICRRRAVVFVPNYDLLSITSNVNNDHVTGYWEGELLKHCKTRGLKITLTSEVEKYARALCIRILYDDIFLHILDDVALWTAKEREAVILVKNAFVRIVRLTGDPFSRLAEWINVLSFTKVVEVYLLSFFTNWFENKKFLEKRKCMWLMDALTFPV